MGVPAGDHVGLTDAVVRDGVPAGGRAHSVPRLVVGRVGALAAARAPSTPRTRRRCRWCGGRRWIV